MKLALIQTRTCWHDAAANRALFDEWFAKVAADTNPTAVVASVGRPMRLFIRPPSPRVFGAGEAGFTPRWDVDCRDEGLREVVPMLGT